MKKDTLLTQLGRNPELHAGSVNMPLFQTSTVIFPTLKAYFDADKGKPYYELTKGAQPHDYGYGLGGTPTIFALQDALAKLEGAEACLLSPSGLSAITFTLTALLSPGDHILVTDSVYGPTRRFCNKELKRLGIETTYYDPLIGKEITKLCKPNTKIIFLEAPGSLTFEMQDVPAITKVAKAKNITTIIDNSWATPLFFKPFDHGVDISIQAITKYIGGHSDVLMGAVLCNKAQFEVLNMSNRHYGLGVSPADCVQVLKGLRTLDVRLKKHEASALKIAGWVAKQMEVSRVLYPALPSDPGHKLWKRDFTGANGLFSFVLKKHYDFKAISAFIDGLELFGIGASWGGYESLAIYFDPITVRTAKPWKAEGSCIRLHIGLDNPDDLIKDLEKGLKRL